MADDIPNILTLLDEVRSIAQTGLHYTEDKHDRERYQRLFDLSAGKYAGLAGLTVEHIQTTLKKELGPITPKVGAAAAIFDEEGRILLIRRHDTHQWSYPAGAGEVNETAQECAVREVEEETGLTCEASGVIDAFFYPAGLDGKPYAIWVVLVHCLRIGGTLQTTDEALEVGYFHPDDIPHDEWHKESEARCRRAIAYWQARRP
jgi:8-oxo-dGTP pyrophosphatase MutT (NUDIX family)